MISVCYQNVRGLRTQSAEFFFSIASSSYNVIVLTETWLSSETPSSDYFTDNYVVFRSDSTGPTSKNCGGRVLIAVDKSLNCRRRSHLETASESVWVEVLGGSKNSILISNFYIPPSINYAEFQRLMPTQTLNFLYAGTSTFPV